MFFSPVVNKAVVKTNNLPIYNCSVQQDRNKINLSCAAAGAISGLNKRSPGQMSPRATVYLNGETTAFAAHVRIKVSSLVQIVFSYWIWLGTIVEIFKLFPFSFNLAGKEALVVSDVNFQKQVQWNLKDPFQMLISSRKRGWESICELLFPNFDPKIFCNRGNRTHHVQTKQPRLVFPFNLLMKANIESSVIWWL